MTVRDLAKLLEVSQGTVSRYERGERTPKPEYVARVAGTLGVTGSRYDELVEFATTATAPNMIVDGSKGLHRHLIELSEFDRTAERVLHVAPILIPGPMQTRSYAREMMISLPPDEQDVRVELRMARAAALNTPRQVDVILAERALREPFGSDASMAEQVRHVLALSQQENITVRVLPSRIRRWTLAHDGAFVFYEFTKAHPIVHLEHFRGPAFLYDVQDVKAYREETDTLMEAAMSQESSKELMASIADQFEGSSQ
ncbi:transcriptional regulator [Actinopolyspora mortivallis]|uniref:Transcriptional regulator n=2 Tax=Actinopolyspora mortivallis TaxID=33906 RepID=A0A2T0H1H3_ACTMO|nr:transcriptional regulator [Actinopolyspora mortivallis]